MLIGLELAAISAQVSMDAMTSPPGDVIRAVTSSDGDVIRAVVDWWFSDRGRSEGGHVAPSSWHFQSNVRAVSEQFSEQFQSSFPGLVFIQLQSSFRAVPLMFQSSFRAVSERFQCCFGTVSEQFPSNFGAFPMTNWIDNPRWNEFLNFEFWGGFYFRCCVGSLLPPRPFLVVVIVVWKCIFISGPPPSLQLNAIQKQIIIKTNTTEMKSKNNNSI